LGIRPGQIGIHAVDLKNFSLTHPGFLLGSVTIRLRIRGAAARSISKPMVTHSEPAYDVFKALADPTRREVLAILRTGEQSVNSIAREFAMTRPAVSKHLRLLLDARLVSERRDGRNRLYHLNTQPLRDVDRWLSDYRALWQNKLLKLKSYLEEPPRRKH